MQRRTPPSPGGPLGALYLLPDSRSDADDPPVAPPPGFPQWLPDPLGDDATSAVVAHPARKHWDRLAPLVGPDVLTEATAPTFALLCVALATYEEADAILQAAGMLIPGDGGWLMENPALRVRDRADAQVAKWAKVFGLSPDAKPRRPVMPAPSAGKPEQPGRIALPHLYE